MLIQVELVYIRTVTASTNIKSRNHELTEKALALESKDQAFKAYFFQTEQPTIQSGRKITVWHE